MSVTGAGDGGRPVAICVCPQRPIKLILPHLYCIVL